jgi:hypothetical protein
MVLSGRLGLLSACLHQHTADAWNLGKHVKEQITD